jgi:hypothetical protein
MAPWRTEVDGDEYLVLHYRFAINNPQARMWKDQDTYFAHINGINYVLGFTDRDGDVDSIIDAIEHKIHKDLQ